MFLLLPLLNNLTMTNTPWYHQTNFLIIPHSYFLILLLILQQTLILEISQLLAVHALLLTSN